MTFKKTEYVVRYTTRDDPRTIRMRTFTNEKDYDKFWKYINTHGGKILELSEHPYKPGSRK